MSAELRTSLLALISATANSPTGDRLCRTLLKTAVSVVLDEPANDEQERVCGVAEKALGELAFTLSMAAEHAEALRENAIWITTPRSARR